MLFQHVFEFERENRTRKLEVMGMKEEKVYLDKAGQKYVHN